MEDNFSCPVLVFCLWVIRLSLAGVVSLRHYAFFSFRARHSLHSLHRFVWSSSRWQIATAVFSNAPRRSCYPKPTSRPADSASKPDLTVSRHPAPQLSILSKERFF